LITGRDRPSSRSFCLALEPLPLWVRHGFYLALRATIIIYTMLKHSGSATRLGADSPDEPGGWERTLRERDILITTQKCLNDHFLSPFSLRTRFTVCFSLPMKKLISKVDSVSEVCKSGITISVSTSPKCCILDACFDLSVSL